MSDTAAAEAAISDFFNANYTRHERYWWRGDNRYSPIPEHHTSYNAAILQAARRRQGRALDLGAGEGADAIRLAKLGWDVDAIELSAVACEKIERFARAEHVAVTVRNESIAAAALAPGGYDLVLMNGSLHYLADKAAVLAAVLAASAPAAIHAVSLFSTASPTPAEHAVVPVFPDDEDGVVEHFYQGHRKLLHALERGKTERSHPGFGAHQHSYIKLITELDPAEPR